MTSSPIKLPMPSDNGTATIQEYFSPRKKAAAARCGFRNRFADALRGEMERRCLSVRDIADVCAVSLQAVYYWLDETNEPSGFALSRLNLLFGAAFNAQVAGVIALRTVSQR